MARKLTIRALVLAFILLASGLVIIPAPAAAEQWAKVDMGKPYGGTPNTGLYGVAGRKAAMCVMTTCAIFS